MRQRKPDNASLLLTTILCLLTLVVIGFICCFASGCQGKASAKTTHDATTVIRANEGAALDSIKAADTKTESVRAAEDTPAPAKQTLAAVHDDHAAAIKDLSANVKPIAAVDTNADQLQKERDKEHNTIGNRIERFILGIFWWIVGIAATLAVVATVISLIPGGAAITGPAIAIFGHGVAAVVTGGIPYIVHLIGWGITRLVHIHSSGAPITMTAATTAQSDHP